MFRNAITRRPGPDFGRGLTRAGLGTPDLQLATAQHAAYVAALRAAGLEVTELAPLAGHPDAWFVEDPAVVTPEVAVLTRPGAAERRGEGETLEAALAAHRPVVRIEPPGTLDGGDVLAIDGHYYVGISSRTNDAGAEQLGRILSEHGHTWRPVAVSDGLHLKSSVNHVGGGVVLIAETFAAADAFSEHEQIPVDPDEEHACNTLLVNERLLVPAGFPRTRVALERLGLAIVELDTSEMRKMDGGLTCLSLRF